MATGINIDLSLGAVTESIRKFFDERKFSDQERAQIDLELRQAETSLGEKELAFKQALADSEARTAEAQSALLVAEATGESWLQRNWRPVLMVVFAFLLICTWFGLFSQRIGPDLQLELLNLVKLGMGGYILGRSAEKIAGRVAGK
jgi:hypothetical protein